MSEKELIASLIAKASEQDASIVVKFVETPPDKAMGDFAYPCFPLAKVLHKAPPMIAGDIKTAIEAGDVPAEIDHIEVKGGYLNFFLDRAKATAKVVRTIIADGDDYAKSNEGNGKRVLLDFSSPNIAKPFHIGHLCSTAIGSSLSRIYSFLGYEAVKINHIGDWGTQFGKLISAYKRWGNEEVVTSDPINELLKLYVHFHEEAEKEPSLDDEARGYFKRLEDGDEEVTKLWKFFVDASIKEFKRMYERLDIEFDSYAGESFYSDKMPEVVEIMKNKGLLEESEGAQVVRFDDPNMPPCIIVKSDGSTIYATRDLAAAIYRKRHYDFFKNIYVVGTPQALHFKQVFGCLDKMGFECAKDCVHVGFGYVRFPDRVLSTRHGDVVLLEDVLNEAVEKTREIILESPTTKNVKDVDSVAETVGIGAVLYAFLKNGRERDIIFTWKDMLDFEGESGPYVQYSYARAKSLLRKAEAEGVCFDNADASLLTGDDEYALITLMNKFQNVVRDAADKYEPCVITRYATELAQTFNKFYNNCQIMKADGDIKAARLLLCKAYSIVIRSALSLIGLKVVEQM